MLVRWQRRARVEASCAARETHARELANARKEMAEAVAAKDAEVRAAQDAHTRLLDAEAKRRADVQRAVEEKEMKLFLKLIANMQRWLAHYFI